MLATAYEVEQRLTATRDPALVPALADIRRQLTGLVHVGFVTETGWRQLHDLPRYLKAIAHRLDRLPGTLARDRQLMVHGAGGRTGVPRAAGGAAGGRPGATRGSGRSAG